MDMICGKQQDSTSNICANTEQQETFEVHKIWCSGALICIPHMKRLELEAVFAVHVV